MHKIFIKYNRDRIPSFRTETYIYREPDGSKSVIKRALHQDAIVHIAAISANYQRLADLYPHVSLAKCKLEKDRVKIEYLEGETLETRLVAALQKKDKNHLKLLLGQYSQYLLNYYQHNPGSEKKETLTVTGGRFSFLQNVFKESSLPAMASANIDINFDNIIIDQSNRFHLVDYEWAFNFPLPLLFIAYRAVYTFINKFHGYFLDITGEDLYNYFCIDQQARDKFYQVEEAIQNYIFGENPINDRYLQKGRTFESLIQELDQKERLTSAQAQLLDDKDQLISAQLREIDEQNKHIASQKLEIEDKAQRLVHLNQQLEQLNQLVADQTLELEQKTRLIEEVINSRSWKITAPFRWLGEKVSRHSSSQT